jgi:hypothetical protein
MVHAPRWTIAERPEAMTHLGAILFVLRCIVVALEQLPPLWRELGEHQ